MSQGNRPEDHLGRQSSPQERREAAEAYTEKVTGSAHETLPQVDMNTFVLSLSSSALVNLGEVPDPDDGQTRTNLSMARHTIDVLSMLEDRTRGNLTQEEEDLLKNVLFELRMKYVQKC